MLAIKNFAKDVSVNVDFGVMKENDIHKIKASFDLMEEANNG